MPNLKISQLTSGNPSQTGDLIPVARGGANFSVTAQSIAALGGGSFSNVGEACFWGPGLVGPIFGNSISTLAADSNILYVFKFVLQSSWTIRNCSYIWSNNFGSAGINFAIYDIAKNLVLDSGSFNLSLTANTVHTNTFSPITIPAGSYYFAEATDFSGLAAPVMSPFSSPSSADMAKLFNAISLNTASATNTRTAGAAGAMPATLGTLTALSDVSIGFGLPLWTP